MIVIRERSEDSVANPLLERFRKIASQLSKSSRHLCLRDRLFRECEIVTSVDSSLRVRVCMGWVELLIRMGWDGQKHNIFRRIVNCLSPENISIHPQVLADKHCDMVREHKQSAT